jgi:hypothetical protein
MSVDSIRYRAIRSGLKTLALRLHESGLIGLIKEAHDKNDGFALHGLIDELRMRVEQAGFSVSLEELNHAANSTGADVSDPSLYISDGECGGE